MKHVVTVAFGVLCLLLESASLQIFGLEQVAAQTGVVIAVFLGTRRGFVAGGISLAFLMGPIGWMASGPGGFYATGIVAVFVASRLFKRNLHGEWGWPQVVLVGVMSVVHLVVAGLVMLVLQPSWATLGGLAWSAGLAVLGAAAAAWPIGRALERIDQAFERAKTSGQLSMR